MRVFIRKSLIVWVCCVFICSCSQPSHKEQEYINKFKDTQIKHLVEAINQQNVEEIDRLVKNNPSILKYTDSIYGFGVLEVCIDLEKYNSFKRLLELGANPNYTNPINHYSILIESIRPFGSDKEWRLDNRYALLLLKNKADPNYSTERTEDDKGYSHIGYSPLIKASSLNLEIVKELVKYGGDIKKRVNGMSPLGAAVSGGKYDIAKYYIDSLHVKLDSPLIIREKDSLYIQDLITNKFTIAKIKSDKKTIDSLKKINPHIEKANNERWELIQKLENQGVNFKNYMYKK